jgi:hypothetical protein
MITPEELAEMKTYIEGRLENRGHTAQSYLDAELLWRLYLEVARLYEGMKLRKAAFERLENRFPSR